MDTFLVATDGSETAMKAADRAVSEAAEHGAKLFAVHVIDTEEYAATRKRGGWQQFYEGLREHGREIAKEVCDMAEERDVPVECVLLEGRPSEEVVGFAGENDVDQIFVGTVGRSGLSEVLLGSTAERVIRTARCPVTVVPAGYRKTS